jgi:hypothetical protein
MLGGSIAIKTKTGFSSPKQQLEVIGGSWDRHSEELTSGWNGMTALGVISLTLIILKKKVGAIFHPQKLTVFLEH